MTDLFGGAKVAQKCRKVERAPPLWPKGKSEGGAPCPGGAGVAQPVTKVSPLAHKQTRARWRSPDNEIDLRSRISALYRSLESANDELAAATVNLDPLNEEWLRADSVLRAAWLDRADHSKEEMLAFYDARVAAGFARNPLRQRVTEATRWRKAIFEELEALNKASGV